MKNKYDFILGFMLIFTWLIYCFFDNVVFMFILAIILGLSGGRLIGKGIGEE